MPERGVSLGLDKTLKNKWNNTIMLLLNTYWLRTYPDPFIYDENKVLDLGEKLKKFISFFVVEDCELTKCFFLKLFVRCLVSIILHLYLFKVKRLLYMFLLL